jgi:glucose uptake protein
MILPQTSSLVLILMVVSMLLLGVWAGMFKAAGKWRFELFYCDFAFGLLLAAVIFSFTLGDLGYDGFSFFDDLQHAGKRQLVFGLLAGVIFNLGNMLLLGAVSVAGLWVAFPMSLGVAVVVTNLAGLLGKPATNNALIVLGCGLVLTSVVVSAIAYRIMVRARHEELARAGVAKSTRRPNPVKGILLAVIGGLLMASIGGLMAKVREGDIGLGPYSAGALFALGMFLSSLVFSVFLMNLPVEGEPLEFSAYFKGRPAQHVLGLLAGVLWYGGTLAALVSTSLPVQLQPAPLGGFLLAQGAPIVTALLGILVFREIRGGDMRLKMLAFLMIALFVCGLAMIGLAPVYMPKT